MNKYHITFDLDWSPDICVEDILNLLRKNDIKSTFFITHNSDMIKKILSNGHELGIHPNFNPKSSHGKTIEEVIDFFKSFLPDARSFRTHGLVQSTNLLSQICQCNQQLKYDFSLYIPNMNSRKINWNYFDNKLSRMTYNWEDDFNFFGKFPKFNDTKIFKYNIFNFHPIHIYLNSKNYLNYEMMKNKFYKIQNLKKKDLESFKSNGYGTRNFFIDLLTSKNKHINFDRLINLKN